MRDDKPRHATLIGLIALLVIAVASSGCGYAGAADSAESPGLNNGWDDSTNGATNGGNVADISLYDTDLETARTRYADSLSANPSNGQAAAGHAVTDILLLPYAPETTDVLRHVGASDSIDAQGDVIYGESGFLYFVSRGVPWEDSGPDTVGIKSLLVDRLPWTRKQLDSLDGLVDGLSRPVDFMAEDLVQFAGRLDTIKTDIDVALDDPNFSTFFIPGEVFHDEELDLTLGRSELALAKAALSGVQTAIYFFAAYDHPWTLERALGTTVWEAVIADPESPDYVEGFAVVDYQVAHLNASFLRSIGRPNMLRRAQQALADTFAGLREGVELGVEEQAETILTWQDVDQRAASDLVTFLTALENAAMGPAEIPFTEPALTADFSLLASEGRTIPMETDPFVVTRFENEFGATETNIELTEAALEAMADGVFDPPYGSEPAPELSTAEQFEALVDAASGTFTSDVERTYSGSF